MLKQLGFAAALLGGTLVMTPAMAQNVWRSIYKATGDQSVAGFEARRRSGHGR